MKKRIYQQLELEDSKLNKIKKKMENKPKRNEN
jgi:hypothetical protein